MKPVLLALAIADLLLFLASGALGFLVGDDRSYARHFILSLFTLVLTLFIHVAVFTYFTVTGKMISQAVLIGHLDREPLDRVKVFKARVSRWVAVASLFTIVVGAFGAVCANAPSWHVWHSVSAAAALGVNAWAFMAEYDYVTRNRLLIDEVFEAYNAQRKTRASG